MKKVAIPTIGFLICMMAGSVYAQAASGGKWVLNTDAKTKLLSKSLLAQCVFEKPGKPDRTVYADATATSGNAVSACVNRYGATQTSCQMDNINAGLPQKQDCPKG